MTGADGLFSNANHPSNSERMTFFLCAAAMMATVVSIGYSCQITAFTHNTMDHLASFSYTPQFSQRFAVTSMRFDLVSLLNVRNRWPVFNFISPSFFFSLSFFLLSFIRAHYALHFTFSISFTIQLLHRPVRYYSIFFFNFLFAACISFFIL